MRYDMAGTVLTLANDLGCYMHLGEFYNTTI